MSQETKMEFKITSKKPKENEKICENCNGTGWIQKEDEYSKYIEKCNRCDNGLLYVCPDCGNVQKYKHATCYSTSCTSKREAQEEQLRFCKAKKFTLSEVPRDAIEFFYSEVYGYDDGYFYDIDSIEDYCNEHEIDMPTYVWCTTKKELTLNAYDIIQSQLEEWYEDAIDSVSDIALEKLQAAMSEFCKTCGVGNCNEVDYNALVLLESEVEQ